MTGRFFNFLVEIPVVWMILWLGLAGLTGALLVLMGSRWGQNRPLRKCAVLSLVAHVLLAGFATTVQIVTGVTGSTSSQAINVSIVAAGDPAADELDLTDDPAPWEVPADEPSTEPASAADAPPPRENSAEPTVEPSALAGLGAKRTTDEVDQTTSSAGSTQTPANNQPRVATTQPLPPSPAAVTAPPVDHPTTDDPLVPLPDKTDRPVPPIDPIAARPVASQDKLARVQVTAKPVAATSVADDPAVGHTDRETLDQEISPPASPTPVARSKSSADHGPSGRAVDSASLRPTADSSPQTRPSVDPTHIVARAPTIYRNRFAPDRSRVARAHGGSKATEAAVDAALRWLAANQNRDGRWDADYHSAGQERAVLGRLRQNAGLQADTGMTGLALLAFLGAGQTHVTGDHQDTVRRGLDYLIAVQSSDGSLAGKANYYAGMYCHAMATFAISEAFAMTGDPRLEQVVRRAVHFSLQAQNPMTGGWRYLPHDPGDTSQLGWQAMALKSAQLAGIAVPQQTWLAVERFLDSVAAGPQGGLASYRPRSAPSRTMTAEALACRRLLTSRFSPSSEREATSYLLEEPPGTGRPNFYYWYYATLAMFQVQGQPWQHWNEALKTALVSTQRTSGREAGSWDTNTVWGGYGGRVYCTSMAALSLEVYYRYLPVYAEAARHNRQLR